MATASPNLALRRRYAEVIRQFVSGRMTNYRYMDLADDFLFEDGADEAMDAIHKAADAMHCDIRKHRMTDEGRRLSKQARRCVARWIVFLRSGKPLGSVRPRLVECRRSSDVGLGIRMLAGAIVAGLGVFSLIGALLCAASQNWLAASCIGVASLVSIVVLIQLFRFSPARTELRPAEEADEGFDAASIWPFANQDDYQHALRTAGYLGLCSRESPVASI